VLAPSSGSGNQLAAAGGAPPARARRTIATRAPAAHSTISSFTPARLAASAAIPTAPRKRVFIADRPSPHSAWATTAMITGFTP